MSGSFLLAKGNNKLKFGGARVVGGSPVLCSTPHIAVPTPLPTARPISPSLRMSARFFTDMCLPFIQSVGNKTATRALVHELHGVEESAMTMSPLFRQLGCKPSDYWSNAPGRGRTVLVVGLREEFEMLAAVQMGYVAIGFEPMPASITAMAARISKLPLAVRSRVRIVSAAYDDSSDTWRWSPLMPPDVCWPTNRAACYKFPQ